MLSNIIKSEIKSKGGLTIDEFMTLALYHKDYGFYTSAAQIIGQHGAFITAPEISQVFGELIGAYFANTFITLQSTGVCHSVNIIELGPGKGTLMKDFLNGTKNIPGFHQAINKVCMLEISNRLVKEQQKSLKNYLDKVQINWFEDIDSMLSNLQESNNANSKAVTFIIANEFFDALPVKQFDQSGKERMVIIDDNDDSKLSFSFPNEKVAKEISPISDKMLIKLLNFLQKNKGQALIIDYGYYTKGGINGINFNDEKTVARDTLQAICGHKYSNPLEKVGKSDITYHVDFGHMEDIVKSYPKISYSPPITQGEFLRMCGIDIRHKILQKQSGYGRISIDADIKRLTVDMGKLFKVFTFWHF